MNEIDGKNVKKKGKAMAADMDGVGLGQDG
jgi:hypothetical protein